MRKWIRYERILDNCLDCILTQGISLEEAIVAYPEHQDRLRVDLDTALWFQGVGPEFQARPGFITSSQPYLVSKIRKSSLGKARTFKGLIYRDILHVRLILAALLILVIAWGGLAIELDLALPGSPLYGVKTVAQDIRLFFTLDLETEARLHRQYAQEHLIACARATSQGRQEDAKLALWNYERHMAGMSRTFLELDRTSMEKLQWRYTDISRLYLQDMEIFMVLLPGSF